MTQHISQFKKIGIAVLIAVFIYFISLNFFQSTQSSLLALIAFLVTLWTNEALPLGVVSLLPIVLFPAFGILETKPTTLNYAHPIIFLFFGGFLLAIGVEKTKLHVWIAEKILAFFPTTPRWMIFSLALTSGLLSSLLSNTTTALLLVPIAVFISDDVRLKMRFALAIAYGASVGGILTPIGTPPNLILLGVMQDKGMEAIAFFKWMWMVAPLSFLMLVAMSFLLSIGVKDVVIDRDVKAKKLDGSQKKVLFLLFGLIVLLMVNAPVKPYWSGLGLSEPGILLACGLLLFMPPFGILDWVEDNPKIPYAIALLFGAGFSIAKAFSATGLADAVAHYLIHVTHFTPLLMLLAIAFFITFTTEITSNTALTSIMLPVIYSITLESNMDTTLVMMVATLCASYAFMLPIATPPNAIAMSSGAVHIKEMIRYGFFLNIIGIVFIVLIANFFWKYLF